MLMNKLESALDEGSNVPHSSQMRLEWATLQLLGSDQSPIQKSRGWPTQAAFWLEWGTSKIQQQAERSLQPVAPISTGEESGLVRHCGGAQEIEVAGAGQLYIPQALAVNHHHVEVPQVDRG